MDAECFQNHEPSTHELIYYRWSDPKRPDMVPPYATSIEGGGLIVLSPDESKVTRAVCGGETAHMSSHDAFLIFLLTLIISVTGASGA